MTCPRLRAILDGNTLSLPPHWAPKTSPTKERCNTNPQKLPKTDGGYGGDKYLACLTRGISLYFRPPLPPTPPSSCISIKFASGPIRTRGGGACAVPGRPGHGGVRGRGQGGRVYSKCRVCVCVCVRGGGGGGVGPRWCCTICSLNSSVPLGPCLPSWPPCIRQTKPPHLANVNSPSGSGSHWLDLPELPHKRARPVRWRSSKTP